MIINIKKIAPKTSDQILIVRLFSKGDVYKAKNWALYAIAKLGLDRNSIFVEICEEFWGSDMRRAGFTCSTVTDGDIEKAVRSLTNNWNEPVTLSRELPEISANEYAPGQRMSRHPFSAIGA